MIGVLDETTPEVEGEPTPWFDKIQAATGLILTYLQPGTGPQKCVGPGSRPRRPTDVGPRAGPPGLSSSSRSTTTRLFQDRTLWERLARSGTARDRSRDGRPC